MKKLRKKIQGKKYVVFLDFEGTQYTHEMIEIGAVKCKIDRKGFIVKQDKPFRRYVIARNKIGKIVTNLTGITEETLKKNAVPFASAMQDFKKYCGRDFKKCLFSTFGNHDIRIIHQSVLYNVNAPTDIVDHICDNWFDFLDSISEFVKDDNNNPLSLVNYCKLFSVQEAGTAHDATVDAINLANLYDAFLKKNELVFESYKKVLAHTRGLPPPVKFAITKLALGENVSVEEFDQKCREYIK